jgi:hypothetical protein
VTVFKYYAYHPVQRWALGGGVPLAVRNPVWTEALSVGTTLSFSITVPADPFKISRIREATEPDVAAIYVTTDEGVIPWGGVVKKREWDPDNSTWTITCVEWRSWLYSILLSPKKDLSGDNTYTYTALDQLEIARRIINIVTFYGAVEGVPPILRDASQMSGVLRSSTYRGTTFSNAGKELDLLAGLSNGFEWDIEIVRSPVDQLPIMKFVMYYPQRGGLVPTLLFRVNQGKLEGLTEDSTNVATRMWAIGEGPNAESLPYSVDIAPELVNGYRLRADAASQYAGVYDRTTLASYARAERRYRDVDLDVVTFSTTLNNPEVMSYQKGDRGRLIYKDRVYNIDVPAARILSKEVSPEINQVKVTVDLSDVAVPEVDPGGAV